MSDSCILDLQCEAQTLAGPIDDRVLESIRESYPLDDHFVQQFATCHGGVPTIGTFRVGDKTESIGRFLTLIDDESILEGPERPHFEHGDTDERIMMGIPYLLDGEHQTSRGLFMGLVPFAALLDEMRLDQSYVDLLCLDFRDSSKAPPVVLWMSHQALDSLMEWDDLPEEEQFDDDDNFLNVPWDNFLVPVAADFQEFILSLTAGSA
jgi:hypothetical protein